MCEHCGDERASGGYRRGYRAGRHRGCSARRGGPDRNRKLAPPDNIVLLRLSPYSPELNPMETVFQYLKNNRLANRVFSDVAAATEACREAWDWFAAARDRIASIMRRE